MPPDPRAFESAIFRHIERMALDEMPEQGTLYVKVALHDEEPGDEAVHGELFLSMPRLGAHPEWMAKVMQHVRVGFARDELEVSYGVAMQEPGDRYAHTDEEVGGVLLTLPAIFSATRSEQRSG